MVELIRNNEATLANERRNQGGVGGKAHGADERVLLASELSDEIFRDLVDLVGTTFETCTAGGDTVALDGFFDNVGTPTAGLCKAEVIVG